MLPNRPIVSATLPSAVGRKLDFLRDNRQVGSASDSRAPPHASKRPRCNSHETDEGSNEQRVDERNNEREDELTSYQKELAALTEEHGIDVSLSVRTAKVTNVDAAPTYKTGANKWLHYLRYDDKSKKRARRLDGNLLTNAGRDNAMQYLAWLEEGAPGYELHNGVKLVLTPNSLEVTHATLQSLYRNQRKKAGADGIILHARLMDYRPYAEMYKALLKHVSARYQRSADVQQASTGRPGLDHSLDELIAMARYCMEEGSTCTRDCTLLLWNEVTVGRIRGLHAFRVSNLVAPQVVANMGPYPCYVLAMVGEADPSGQPPFVGCVRHSDPLLCGQRWLAQWLCERFTLGGEPLPNAVDPNAFHAAALFPARKAGETLSHAKMCRALKALATAVGICGKAWTQQSCTTHGIDDEVALRMAMAATLQRSCAQCMQPEALLALGKWPHLPGQDLNQCFWAERFYVGCRQELAVHVFPWLHVLREGVAGLGEEVSESACSALSACEYLATVLVQDSLELHDAFPAAAVHRHLAAHPAFRRLLESYKQQKAASAFEPTRPHAGGSAGAGVPIPEGNSQLQCWRPTSPRIGASEQGAGREERGDQQAGCSINAPSAAGTTDGGNPCGSESDRNEAPPPRGMARGVNPFQPAAAWPLPPPTTYHAEAEQQAPPSSSAHGGVQQLALPQQLLPMCMAGGARIPEAQVPPAFIWQPPASGAYAKPTVVLGAKPSHERPVILPPHRPSLHASAKPAHVRPVILPPHMPLRPVILQPHAVKHNVLAMPTTRPEALQVQPVECAGMPDVAGQQGHRRAKRQLLGKEVADHLLRQSSPNP